MERVLFWLAFFAAYTVQAVSGFAGNIFAMPAGVATIGMEQSVTLMNICGFLACGIIAVRWWGDVNKRELLKICLSMAPFVVLGAWIDTLLSLGVLMKIFGTLVLLVGIKNIVRPASGKLPEWALWGVLFFSGLIQGMFVSGGAFLVIYALQKLPGKAEFRSTLSAVWMVLNFCYAAFMLATGHATPEIGITLAGCIPLIIVATLLGTAIARRISQAAFLRLTYLLLIAIGVVLILK